MSMYHFHVEWRVNTVDKRAKYALIGKAILSTPSYIIAAVLYNERCLLNESISEIDLQVFIQYYEIKGT